MTDQTPETTGASKLVTFAWTALLIVAACAWGHYKLMDGEKWLRLPGIVGFLLWIDWIIISKSWTLKKHLFDNAKNVNRLLTIFFSSVFLLIFLDLPFILEKHPHFESEKWFGFYAVYGFVACVVLVLIAKYILSPIVMRKEDYYD